MVNRNGLFGTVNAKTNEEEEEKIMQSVVSQSFPQMRSQSRETQTSTSTTSYFEIFVSGDNALEALF